MRQFCGKERISVRNADVLTTIFKLIVANDVCVVCKVVAKYFVAIAVVVNRASFGKRSRFLLHPVIAVSDSCAVCRFTVFLLILHNHVYVLAPRSRFCLTVAVL